MDSQPAPMAGNALPIASEVGSGCENLEATTPGISERDIQITCGPPVEPGEVGTLGPYRILKELGRGGMGAVYAAVDTRLNRRLALKVMLPRFAAKASAKDRFLREARAAAQVTHDNVVTIYEADERDGVPYIAMQYLDGSPLDEYLRKHGNPSLPQVLRIAQETAAGLAAAHRHGLVHRDIKPGNLWLETPDGRIKVLDFGLAKPVDADVEITKTGAIVGTPAYMSPEQAQGEKVDGRTDLFSLGVVLYRLCTGQPPFQGPTTMAMLLALANKDPVPVRTLNPTVPDSLADLIHRLLAKSPADRPASADDVVRRIQAIANPDSSRSPSRTSVVYVPIDVTALDSSLNPFADIDVPGSTETVAKAELPADHRNRGGVRTGGGVRIAIGIGVVAVLAIATVTTIAILNRGRSVDSRTAETNGTHSTASQNSGSQPTVPEPTNKSPDRKAAEWAIGLGGTVKLEGSDRLYTAVGQLPKTWFTLNSVSITGATQVTEGGLAPLKSLRSLNAIELMDIPPSEAWLRDLKEIKGLHSILIRGAKFADADMKHIGDITGLASLSLGNTSVGDAGLEQVGRLKNLSHLYLWSTKVTGAGLIHVSGMKNLSYLDLNRCQISSADVAHLTGLTNLRNLYLGASPIDDSVVVHLQRLKNLQILHVRSSRFSAGAASELHRILPACRIEHDGGTLEPKVASDANRHAAEWVLSIGGTIFIDGHDREFSSVDQLPKDRFVLNSVNLAKNRQLARTGLADLRGLKELKGLDLNGAEFSDAELKHLSGLTELTYLNLHGTAVTDVGAVHLQRLVKLGQLYLGDTAVTDRALEHVRGAVKMEAIYLYGTKISDAGLKHLAGMSQLGILSLNGTAVTDDGLLHLKTMKTLTDLQLRSTAVSDRGLAHLTALPQITQLELGGTQVTDRGMDHLKKLGKLESIYLYETSLSDQGLAVLRDMKNLKILHVKRTKVTPQGLTDFSSAVPGCRLEHDGGVIEPKK